MIKCKVLQQNGCALQRLHIFYSKLFTADNSLHKKSNLNIVHNKPSFNILIVCSIPKDVACNVFCHPERSVCHCGINLQ